MPDTELRIGGTVIPLQSVSIEAVVNGTAAQVEVRQHYVNSLTKPLEALYVFPLEEGAAITAFSAEIGDKIVRAALKPRAAAFAAYDSAMSEGHGAYLLEQQRANRFSASLGNIPPGAAVVISVRYVTPLQVDRDGIRLMLPTTLTPRYRPQRTQRDDVEPQFAAHTDYRLRVAITVEHADDLARIESPSHPIAVEMQGQRAVISLSSDKVFLDRDVVVRMQLRESNRALVRRTRSADGSEMLQLLLQPELGDLHRPARRELIFVLDCSGSMSGDSIVAARRALELCLRAMREGDVFNICRFGSSFELLWPQPQPYSADSLKQALELLSRTGADLGGTEILEPLKAISAAALSAGISHRDVFVLTDGAVSNEDEVLQRARATRGTTRIFSFGIGTASDLLVRGLARNSGGAAEFIAPNERIEPAVLRMFGRLNDPILSDLQVDWGGLQVEAMPSRLPSLFSGDLLTVYARVNGGQATAVTVSAGTQRWTLAVPATAELDESALLATLWARELLRELEEGSGAVVGSNQRRRGSDQQRTERIREISLKYGLLSSETAFVAVEERIGADRTTEQSVFLQVPNQLPAGMDDDQRMYSPPILDQAMSMLRSLSSNRFQSLQSAEPDHLQSMRSMFAPSSPSPASPRASKRRGTPPSAASLMRSIPDAPAESQAPADTLIDLLLTQAFDGSFDPAFVLTLFPQQRAALEQLAAAHGAALVATLAAVSYCRRNAADRADLWSSAVEKAAAWLQQQAAADAVRPLIEQLLSS